MNCLSSRQTSYHRLRKSFHQFLYWEKSSLLKAWKFYFVVSEGVWSPPLCGGLHASRQKKSHKITLPCLWKFTLLTGKVALVTRNFLRHQNDRNVAKLDFIQTQVSVEKKHFNPRGAISKWLLYQRKEERKHSRKAVNIN